MNRTWLLAVLLVAGAALAVWNWQLRPDRAIAWGASLAMLGVMAVVLWRARNAGDPHRAASGLRAGVGVGATMMVFSLLASLARTLAVPHDQAFAQRASMAVLGVYFMATGNSMPKLLTPLASLRCDAGRVQAYQRAAGWTWVLTGLGYSAAWLVMPMDHAETAGIAVLVSGMLVTIGLLLRLKTSRPVEGRP